MGKLLSLEKKLIIVSWVKSKQTLARVSGDDGNSLTIDILNAWLDKSIHYISIEDENRNIVGFCTLETILNDEIEMCHLLVKPRSRHYIDIGCSIIKKAINYSRSKNYNILWGRAISGNSFTYKIAVERNNFDKILDIPIYLDSRFDWYKLHLNH
jgi:hypothetical protein